MCTRFYVEPDTEEFRAIIAEAMSSPLARKFVHAGSAVLQSGEIRPTNVVPVIAPDRNGRQAVFPMKWGFQIPGKSLLVNARCETAAEKPSFRLRIMVITGQIMLPRLVTILPKKRT